ncbi:TonB-dependent receptor [Flavobacterium sp.]|uniref:TonB-dependent receptor n=1 Tax=Flavobacterium sp. TaxID=239 RepID=UPI004047C1F5
MKNLFNTRKTKNLLSFFLALISTLLFAQEQKQDSTKVTQLDEVLVSAVRANSKQPVSFTNMSKSEIAKRNLGQDIPMLLNYLPSVVTTTDAGNGVGYTGIRVRGSDATRVNITINGIPYNDSESHGTYWVNMPDFASSLQSIQLQRGVGTSTNGSGAFGASLNMLTDLAAENANGEISNSFGSFNTRKHTVKFSTGKINNGFELSGRLSNIHSDGYVDRASSDLKSYFLQAAYFEGTTLIKALAFGGTERTYQSWNGIDQETFNIDPTFNSAGMYTDEFGNTRYYDNETDNYQQDHYQLHWNEKWSENWNSNLAIHYTKGKGYYENYKEDEDFADYSLQPVLGQTSTDLIRQKWLDNDFYGTTFSTNYNKGNFDFILGGAWNKYEGDHFGKVIWARYASTSELDDKYYNDYGTKTDGNLFAKASYELPFGLSLFGDLQYRTVNYKANGVQANLVDDTFNFFNPKAGLTYKISNKQSVFFSYARANREPNRTDYKNGTPKPEQLDDFELGWKFNSSKAKLNINTYFMSYKDQLVLTGELDNVGAPIRSNSGDSHRIGLEVEATVMLSKNWIIAPNFTLSKNKNIDFYTDVSGTLENIGNTDIAYSPEVIIGNQLIFNGFKNFQIGLLSKFVGKQYLNNTNDERGVLADYFVNDFNLIYTLPMTKLAKELIFTVNANNIFDKKYASNAADYGGGYVYFYPQAGANIMAGLTIKF